MEHLDRISMADLHRALEEVEGKKPTQRLLAAIAYKNGVTQTELADWYGVERRTIYAWLKRLEHGSLTDAVTDEHRSGRPRKLTDDQRVTLERALQATPATAGYDAGEWTPPLVQQFIEDSFDVAYSIPSCRRFMNEARDR
ncbi:helix-turn-helix domain-containing protein [Haladaptatus sp. DJG-WS-42]|uniref:helix-turn-helix domain-containing protein n=1 Tax=Haladaptatus sp. DJG-WS-42 TaxID=3120516 RepID=UPI0030D0B789